MNELTIVTAVTPGYHNLLKWTLPTWTLKRQLRAPLIVFHHGFKSDAELAWIAKAWPCDVRLVHWPMKEAADDRERMISSFVLGAAKYVKTSHFIKMDADCFAFNGDDPFDGNDFDASLASHKWHYTKPAWWIDALDAWAQGKKHEGRARHSVGHPRIISFCCLHKTDFVREAAKLAGSRLPVPSHDTYLWWLASKVKGFTWRSKNLKKLGLGHGPHNHKKMRERICALDGAWNSYHYARLLENVQLEITTECNLGCPNCDRNCGTARSDEQMTLEQVQKFVSEAIDHMRLTGIRFRRIDIIGGEPTLHPDLVPILNEVNRLRTEANAKVRFTSNGTGEKVKSVLAMIEERFPWVKVRNSAKEKGRPSFDSVNLAPIDCGVEQAQACSIPWRCGIALSRYGFFFCGAGASIARVFGIPCGIKALADLQAASLLREQRKHLCQVCGHSRSCVKQVTKQETSPTWQKAFDGYKASRPELEVY